MCTVSPGAQSARSTARRSGLPLTEDAKHKVVGVQVGKEVPVLDDGFGVGQGDLQGVRRPP